MSIDPEVQCRLTLKQREAFYALVRSTGRTHRQEIAFALLDHIAKGPRVLPPHIVAQLPDPKAWRNNPVVQTRIPPGLYAALETLQGSTGRSQQTEVAVALLEHVERGPRVPPPPIAAQLPPRPQYGPKKKKRTKR